ncbi:tyrosine-protein phosphatase [Arthrobacter pityocampae]|uniref:tyrosine-protein phosphatase n=1 Tax=Arthrobacter pityocampae TaxID=547334 RepID=UPI0037351C66
MDATPFAGPATSHVPAADSRAPGRADALWEGAVNARDLGGLGGSVQPGRLYRMGRHEWLTEAGWRQAWGQGVRTVIDLRSPVEVGRRETDPQVGSDVVGRFVFLSRPTEDPADEEFRALCGPYLSSPEHYGENLRRWPERFVGIARAFVAAPAGGMVLHCAAGRDRTGLVVAVLLGAAVIGTAEICADYARAVTAMNERYRGQKTPHETPRTDDELAVWLARARTQLEDLLSSLDAARYLRDAGLTADELAGLRARLTHPVRPL